MPDVHNISYIASEADPHADIKTANKNKPPDPIIENKLNPLAVHK